MARKSEQYETRTIRIGYSDKKVRKAIAQGWEIVSTHGGALGSATTITLRRPNPKYQAVR